MSDDPWSWKTMTTSTSGDSTLIATFRREWKLPANTPLIVNLSGSNTSLFSVRYRTEPVRE